MADTLRQRLESKIAKGDPGECWPFTGSRTARGYGQIWVGTYHESGAPRIRRAHRIVYEMEVGPIAEGLEVCHLCDFPPCCNPAHLFLGTHRENMIHASRNKRWEDTLKGENNPAAKLTAAQVAEARSAFTGARGQVTALAKQYGVAVSTMAYVLRGEHWRPPDA